MARTNKFFKRYQNFFGFDLKSSDLTYPEKYAQSCINLDINPVGSLVKRKGYAPYSDGAGPLGTFVYNRINGAGQEVPERLSVGDTLTKFKQSIITVTYTGSAASASIAVSYDIPSNAYRCVVTEGAATVLDQSLGLGVNETSPYTVDQLKNAIDALTNFSATISGSTLTAAAFCENTGAVELVGSPATLVAGYWEAVQTAPGISYPFSGGYAQVDAIDFEPASSAQLFNVIYFATGHDEIQKYDGQRVYRAGVPTPATVTAVDAGAGFITGNNFVWRARYIQVDKNGNTVEGNLTNSATLVGPVTSRQYTVTVSNLSGTGWNTACGIVNGAQTNVTTINLNAGHTFVVGDTAYFYSNLAPAGYVTREITGRTATSISFAGAVSVTNGSVISANLRVAIYRNKNSPGADPTLWYELAQIPYNAFAASQVYVDNNADASLAFELVEPITDRSPPPKARYLTGFQNLLIAGCLADDPNVVSWSDIESPEYFPTPDNQQVIQNLEGDRITAVAPSNDVLVVFQKNAIHAMSGDLPELNFRVDQITNDVGCIAHQSVRDIRGAIFFLSLLGPRAMTGSGIPQGLGAFEQNPLVSRIDPLFVSPATAQATDVFRLSRAWALHDRETQKYLLFVPKESVSGGVRYCNDGSTLLVYDYARDAWLEWRGLNAGAGITFYNDDVILSERAIKPSLARRSCDYRRQTTDLGLDYNDHNQPISAFFRSPWDFGGEGSLLKNYLCIRVFTTDIVSSQFTLDCSTELDFRKNAISQFSLTIGSDGYGTSPYGQNYGDVQDTSVKHKISNGRTKALAMVFENNEPQTDIVITGYELEIVTPYKPGMKI